MKLISLANDVLVITGFERLEVAGGAPSGLRANMVDTTLELAVIPFNDVTLVSLDDDALMITGFERILLPDGKQADYAESWWVQLRT